MCIVIVLQAALKNDVRRKRRKNPVFVFGRDLCTILCKFSWLYTQDNGLPFEKEEGQSVQALFLSYWVKHVDLVERFRQ